NKQEREQIYETCAELNTLKRMIDENYISEDHIRGCFLVSDTYIGKICGESLSQYCNESYCNGEKNFTVNEIQCLSYDFESFKREGIPNLIKDVIRLSINPYIDDQEIRIAICATGGFKAETAYITILGMILGKPVFYIHENQTSLIYFPPFPVVLNYSKIIRYFDHIYNLKWGIDGNTYKNYEKIWKTNNDDVNMKLFINEINKKFILNDAGLIILEIILNHTDFSEIQKLRKNFIKERVESNDKKFCLENSHHVDWRAKSTGGAPPKPAEKEGIIPLENFLAKILSRVYVKSVQYNVGGLEKNPLRIVHNTSISLPKYRNKSRGGNVQVKFSAHTLTLTIKFNHFVQEYQEKLETILGNKVKEILDSLFDREIGHEVQIKLPNNYINDKLIDGLIDFVNSSIKDERKEKEVIPEEEKKQLIPDHCMGCRWINPDGQRCNRDYEENYGFNCEIDEETGLGVCYEKGEWEKGSIRIVSRERRSIKKEEKGKKEEKEEEEEEID
ncbi:MAG: putative CRISPR-associated protein, partial [Promethearchaeota archaeon]